MLKLTIENFDKLPNGGPLEYQVDRRGFDLGRDQHLDWSLPDKNRVVSGKHCEVRYHDNAYWLYDISTNGTFLNNSSKRIQSPYKLVDGDQLAIGDYIIRVSVTGTNPIPVEPVNAPIAEEYLAPVPRNSDNIWETAEDAPPPIDPRILMPLDPEKERASGFLSQVANISPVFEVETFQRPAPVGGPPQPVDVFVNGPAEVFAQAKSQSSQPAIESVNPGDQEKEFIYRFAKGAGISQDILANINAAELAELSGKMLALTCQHLMSLLLARAEAKALSRSGNRTMIKPLDNNPLKFTPTPEEALRLMLGPKNKGYLDGPQTIENSFEDLKLHQMATLAAMQTAVTKLFEGLAPDAIAKSAENKKSILSGAKATQWDTYVELWSKKVGNHEHGMLGAYLDLFAEHFDKFSKQQK